MWVYSILRIFGISVATVWAANYFRKFIITTSENESYPTRPKNKGKIVGFLRTDVIISFVFSWIIYSFLIQNNFLPSAKLSKTAWIILVLIANIDILFYKIPILLLIVFVLFVIFPGITQKIGINNFLGAFFNFLILYILFVIGKKIYKGKIVPFGFGDVLFGTVLGFSLGFINGLGALSFALILSGITSGILKILKKPNFMTIPLVPFFVSGAIFYILL